MSEKPWQLLPNVRAEGGSFPARTTIDGEGIIVFRTKNGYRGVQRGLPAHAGNYDER